MDDKSLTDDTVEGYKEMDCMDIKGKWYRDIIKLHIPIGSKKVFGPVITSQRFNTTNLGKSFLGSNPKMTDLGVHKYVQCHYQGKMYFPGTKYKVPKEDAMTFSSNLDELRGKIYMNPKEYKEAFALQEINMDGVQN